MAVSKKKTTKTKTVKAVKQIRNLTALSEIEMLKMDLLNSKAAICELKIMVEKYKSIIKDAQLEKSLNQAMEENIKAKKNLKDYNNKIKEELGITSESWGYDHITGEIRT